MAVQINLPTSTIRCPRQTDEHYSVYGTNAWNSLESRVYLVISQRNAASGAVQYSLYCVSLTTYQLVFKEAEMIAISIYLYSNPAETMRLSV